MVTSAPPLHENPIATEAVPGAFEPPSSPALRGIRRRWALVVVTMLLGCLIGLGVGLRRPPTYTAAATLQVGQVNPNSPGFYSYVSSAAALASAFARGVTAEPVLVELHRKLGLAPASAASQLSAAPLPLSPAFSVFATGASEGRAVKLANAAASALIAYEASANDSNPQATLLLREYHAAALAAHRATAALTSAEQSRRASHMHGAGLAELLAPARAARDTAAARLSALGDSYTAAITSQAPRRGLVTLLAGASTARSNRHATIELGAFLGLLAGLVLGCAIATIVELRRA